jgi:SAM-dependent methyltransferase
MLSTTLSDRVWSALACPHCGGALARVAEGARCAGCGTAFGRSAVGQLDLRLRRPQQRQLELTLEAALDVRADGADRADQADRAAPEPGAAQAAPALDGVDWNPLRPNPSPEVDVSGVRGPCHLPRDLRTYFPRAAAAAAAEGGRELALDLGCGAQVHQEVCELAGFEYVGLDYSTPEAMLLGDAQALPFRDGAFGFVLTIAVLEHVPFPLLMMREAHRVLRPGGRLLGTVAFLEPFHQDSLHHHTHLGTLHALRFAGFRVEHIAPSGGWSGLEAQAHMGLFPSAPLWLARLLVAPLLALHRLWWRLGRLADPNATETRRRLKNSGAILFLATRE